MIALTLVILGLALLAFGDWVDRLRTKLRAAKARGDYWVDRWDRAHPARVGRRVIYLAGPYSSPHAAVRQARFRALSKAAAALMAKGHFVFSPITHGYPIEVASKGSPLPSDYWCDLDEIFMAQCTEMAILPLDGWETSTGVKRECEYFEARMLPVYILDKPA